MTGTGTQLQPEAVPVEQPAPQWRLATRIGFRFCFAYFGLYCLTTQILGGLFSTPKFELPDASAIGWVRSMVFWTAAHVFGFKLPLVYEGSGSGDKTFDWVMNFCVLVLAVAATAVWSFLDRKRPNYIAMHKWFRFSIRFALGSELIIYGMVKLIPLQMPYPFLTRMIEPYGNFTPMGVLWSSIGASRSYEMFSGSMELMGGILLMIPRTTLLGAMVALADTVEVFALNMTYDVPVKLMSFHLILLSLFLLAPEMSRLVKVLLTNRPVGPSTQPELCRSRRANRILLAVQVVFGMWLVASNAYNGRSSWYEYGGGRAKPPLYGIWNVEQVMMGGEMRPPLFTDRERWRRAVFDFTGQMSVQRADDSFAFYTAKIDPKEQRLVLAERGKGAWSANLTYRRVGADQLILDGDMGYKQAHLELKLVDHTRFPLVSRGFHWIQEYPVNR